jgi:5'-nucleotidase
VTSTPRFPSLHALVIAGVSWAAGCSATEPATSRGTSSPIASTASPPVTKPSDRVVLSVVGTNDLHGRVHALPLLGGYLANLRAARAEDGGVLLVDAGDMFQGTLESNLVEGRSVVDAYRVLGYHAATIGNHEFDFGPEGPAATPRAPSDDPRGALKALARAASFPMLTANVLEAATKKRVTWPNVPAATVIEVAGVRVGIVGVTTEDTLTSTIGANVADLQIAPLAATITTEASRLRKSERAQVIVVLAHAGGKCERFTGDPKADGCDDRAEIFEVARKIPNGTVDVIVAGHSHAGVAHDVNGIAIIEQFSYGRAFGRVDLEIETSAGRIVRRLIHAPRDLCPPEEKLDLATCEPGEYDGVKVVRDAKVAQAIAPAVEAAREKRAESLSVVIERTIERDYDDESALGNLFADLLKEARPSAAIGIMNGGGLRADLPAGPLTYGTLFEAFPFDNRIATTKLTAKDLAS